MTIAVIDEIDQCEALLVRLTEELETGVSDLASFIDTYRRLERLLDLKAHTDVLLAHRVRCDKAVEVAGTKKPVRFLQDTFGWSKRRASNISTQAARLYGPIKDNPPENEPAEETSKRLEEARQLRALSADKLRRHRLSADMRKLIESSLAGLRTKDARVRESIRFEAVSYGVGHSYDDTRELLNQRVRNVNRSLSKEQCDSAASRRLTITKPGTDGNVGIFGRIAPETAAVLTDQVDREMRKPRPKGDQRSYHQRYEEAFSTVIKRGTGTTESTLVVCISPKDFTHCDFINAGIEHPTNTGIPLTTEQVMALGMKKFGFIAVHDPHTGDVLRLGRFERCANIFQRIALTAAQNVCTHPGCSTPISKCEIHHIEPYAQGGATDIENLTCLCRIHHSDNDDTRAHHAKHHAARDPKTGRVGATRGAGHDHNETEVHLNDSVAAQQAPGAKVRAQAWPQRCPHHSANQGDDAATTHQS
ncbi:HNH endonuclease [Corynebacterium ciconiae DSM 44920]|uniref:HNH endonuclease signature motif containing protein n=1 Tax=Corynebacterium ciconiae TaxID=227319 RepID=UPI00036A494D|nr:HNH endonuclease signature motif containing protein [Corynebacterium ciconiae]WKD61029.1 HNH endonuclease [Corynebacterium ciconiae DSM 44920]